MAGSEGLLFAPTAGAKAGKNIDGLTTTRLDLHDVGIGTVLREADASGLMDDAPTIRLGSRPNLHLLPEPALPSAAPVETPKRKRFLAWSRRYIAGTALADAVVGALAAVIPASFSNTLSEPPTTLILLGLIGAVVWPALIGVFRGYQRNFVGVGSDELRGVLRAAVAVIVAGAFPAGLLDMRALLTLSVVAAPTALILSLAVRFTARKLLHRQQQQGRNVRNVVVVGSWTAAQNLRERLDRESQAGMKIIGAFLPEPDMDRTPVPGRSGARRSERRRRRGPSDRRATPSPSRPTTPPAYNYLRELSWALEGSASRCWWIPAWSRWPGPGCTSGRSWACRCCTSSSPTSRVGGG